MIQLTARTLALGTAALLAALLLGAAGWFWLVSRDRAASTAYSQALAQAQALGPQAAPEARAQALSALEAALGTYPSARHAAQGAYWLGNLRFAARDYAGARAAFEIALRKEAEPTVATGARLGIAYTWEAEKSFDRAASAYAAALEDLGPKNFAFEELLMGLGRTLELSGKKTEAVEAYRRLLKERPESPRAPEVRSRLASLGAA